MSWHPYSYRWGLLQLLHLLLEKQWNIYIYACWCVLKWISIWYRWRHLWFTGICTFHWFFCIHFMFTLFSAQNWFVFDANFNSSNNQDGLFFKYQIILTGCLHVQINSIKTRVTRKSIGQNLWKICFFNSSSYRWADTHILIGED